MATSAIPEGSEAQFLGLSRWKTRVFAFGLVIISGVTVGLFSAVGGCATTPPPEPPPTPVSKIGLALVASGLTSPVGMARDGSGRLFVVDQVGLVRVIGGEGDLLPAPFLDVSSKLVALGAFGPGTFDERGLLGLAFHPNYGVNGKFYIYYSAPRNPDTTVSFDEADIPTGEANFTFQGIDFAGGVVGTVGETPVYSSGVNSYEIAAEGTATMTFPALATRVRFFFVHDEGSSAGQATGVNGEGEAIGGPVSSFEATTFGDLGNFVTLADPTNGIQSLEFQAGSGSGLTLFIDDLEVFDYDHKSVVAEYLVSGDDANAADPESERVLMEIDEPQFNHNSGMLAFGPDDGFLYISVGDGGAGNDVALGHTPGTGNAQDTSNILGNVLRIDVDGGVPFGIPGDNPFVGEAGLDEIYAFGLRNGFRFSFDMGGTHRLFLGDAGQNLFEEVHIVNKGDNLGWNLLEGAHCFDSNNSAVAPDSCDGVDAEGRPLVEPILEYPHLSPDGVPMGVSVIGGYVYRGSWIPGLVGDYIFGDFSSEFGNSDGTLFAADEAADGTWVMRELEVDGSANGRLGRFLLGFGQDEEGEVYVLTTENLAPVGSTGQVHRIVGAP